MILLSGRTRAPKGLRCTFIEGDALSAAERHYNGDGMQKKDKIYRLLYF